MLQGPAPERPSRGHYVWVQGMRRRRNPMRSPSWQELLWCRLTGNLAATRSSNTTTEAERDLGLIPHVYYYVHAPHPRFSESLIGFFGQSPAAVDVASVTPFDSGGMVVPKPQPYIPIDAPDSIPRRISTVHRLTMLGNAYEGLLSPWVSMAHDSEASYSLGQRPRVSFASEVLIEQTEDPSAWLWEGKIPARDYDQPPMRPVFLFMKPGHKSRYFNWLDTNPRMPRDALARHYELVEVIAQEDNDPMAAALRFLA